MPIKKNIEKSLGISSEVDPYVFISYARADSAIAHKVKSCLEAAGFRVFIDTRDINSGSDWSLAIHNALNECHRMVLILSSISMPYHPEVHLEWFYFARNRKPIHTLYIEDCELFYRLYVNNYIDARNDIDSALKRLIDELKRDVPLPEAMLDADRINVIDNIEVEKRSLQKSLQDLAVAIIDPEGTIVLSADQAREIQAYQPLDLNEYRLTRIAEWSLPKYRLDSRFVSLTMMLDRGETEQQRWQKDEEFRFNDLRDVLKKTELRHPSLVLLGAPGSGKSTLLRRMQLDHSIEQLRNGTDQISFFIQLNTFRGANPAEPLDPRIWLNARWADLYPNLPALDTWLKSGRALLLLDALNEMPHRNTEDYHGLIEKWKDFVQDVCRQGNRVIFSCRSLDYSASLSSEGLRVPQVEVQPMNAGQMQTFLRAYIPAKAEDVWQDLEGSPQFGLFQTPYFLKLLCDQVEDTGDVPNGRAGLFTGFIRQVLIRECEKNDALFKPDTLLDEKDHKKVARKLWLGPFDLPERGVLIPKLSDLAYTMQVKGLETEGALIRIGYDNACDLIAHDRARDILKAGAALNIIDEDDRRDDVAFFHQLLQEYFASRRLARQPDPELVRVEWLSGKVNPSLEDTIAGLGEWDPLPPLPQTGWEETTLTATPMAKDPQAYIQSLIPYNLPLAARCAASSEIVIGEALKREIQNALIARTQDMQADLRARIAAGEALGLIGDPRFERRSGPYGDFLMPPLVDIAGGIYPIGDDNGEYDDEKPAHEVELKPYRIGKFPVTNAEYALFIDAGGYRDEKWWDTAEALEWLRDQGEESLQPEYWDDAQYNNPLQPVVGVSWFEARAYCNWLSANSTEHGVLPSGGKLMELKARHKVEFQTFRLPTEVEFEAAARGKKGRLFPYGNKYDSMRGNTWENHLRRPTPVGIFDNLTPEGAYDLSGNAWTWTLSIYDQDKYPYPYRQDGMRNDINATGRRVLRGGSWDDVLDFARAVCRRDLGLFPYGRLNCVGFRVVSCGGPPS